ncbi:tyrosine-type recombinase/integrase [Spirillospora sp. NPDC048911]|uniref:tyrosine-type recombinase/integrase n=1 Tax=Spirillospora sp. NPDC048911 TaxID=3364527 RepID=UPI0037235B58
MASDTSPSAESRPPRAASDTSRRLPGETPSPSRRRGRRGARPTPLPADLRSIFAEYERDVAKPGSPLDADTVRAYASRVRQYLAWLAAASADGPAGGDPLADPGARDMAARHYRAHLETVARRKPATVNAHLTAVDDFYRRRGLGPAATERADRSPAAPRALDERDQIRLLREADRAALRDKAIAFTAFYAGTRISETTGLDTGDVHLTAREGHLDVCYGKNGRYREIPLHPKLRTVLEEWLRERSTWKGADATPALFLNRRGGRLSARSAYTVLRTIADAAGLPLGRDGLFTSHVLRHTAGTTMTRQGTDIVIVAELLGQSVETARRYSLPTREDRQKAIERLTNDQSPHQS